MEYVHKAVADAIVALDKKLDQGQLIMPIGADGAVLYHLLRHYQIQKGLHQEDQMQNKIHATSRTGEIDIDQLDYVTRKARISRRTIYGIDIRTKTGRLKAMLRNYMPDDVDFYYAVLFDPGMHADIRASAEELTEEGRKHIDLAAAVKGREWASDEVWVYKLTHDVISEFDYVKSIKQLLASGVKTLKT